MLEGIVGFEVEVRTMSGKRKVSQNKSAEDRAGVVGGLEAEASGDAAAILEWMRE